MPKRKTTQERDSRYSKNSRDSNVSINRFLKFEDSPSELDTASTIKAFRKLLAEILHFRALVFFGMLLVLIGTAAALLEPRIIGYAIDEGIVPKNWDLLKYVVLAFFVVEVIRVASLAGNSYLFSIVGQKVMHRLRMKLFTHLERLPVSNYDLIPAGKLVTRVTNDISALADMFTAGFVTIVGNILVVVGVIGGMLVLNLELGLIAASVMIPLYFICFHFSKRLRGIYRTARARLSALNAYLAENLLGIREVQLFSREKEHFNRLQTFNDRYAEAQFNTIKLLAIFRPQITIFLSLSMGLVVFFGSQMVRAGEIKIGVLVAFFAYVMAMFEPMRNIIDKWNMFLFGMASVERIYAILEWKPEPQNSLGLMSWTKANEPPEPYHELRGEIEFRNVNFSYKEGVPVLKDVSFKIHPGDKVGIVGPTGSGKTTLIGLLLRFYEVQEGEIRLDGRLIQDFDKRRLRASIGMIQQDVFLFSGSIRENLSLWREDVDPRSLEGFEDLDLDRPLLERGKNLSMGQRQLLAFARAEQTRPRIWILDEATANVDTESEKLLGHRLDQEASLQTRLIIAHRLSTVRDADRILVLNRGRLLEQGSHESLVKKQGLYSRLYRYQESLS